MVGALLADRFWAVKHWGWGVGGSAIDALKSLIHASGKGQMCQSLLGLAVFSPPWLPAPMYPAEVQ